MVECLAADLDLLSDAIERERGASKAALDQERTLREVAWAGQEFPCPARRGTGAYERQRAVGSLNNHFAQARASGARARSALSARLLRS